MQRRLGESPLAQVVRDRRINAILEAMRASVQSRQPITIEPKDIDYIRRKFSKGVLLGEQRLYELVRNLVGEFWKNPKVKTVLHVWGKCPKRGHEDLLQVEYDVSDQQDDLFRYSDTSIAERFTPNCESCGGTTTVILSFMHYDPVVKDKTSPLAIYTRIKTTSNICYKIADMAFDIDVMFKRDKIYSEYSQFVSDMYGLKLVVSENDQMEESADRIGNLPGVEVVEEKSYIGQNRKRSGFEALKLVLRWEYQLFEIQIQTNEMFDTERTSRSANHTTYRERQIHERAKLGKEYVELYQALSQLFATPDRNYCSIDYIELGQSYKGMDDEF